MSSILTVSGSNSVHSINTTFLGYISTLITNNPVEALDLKSIDLPIYNLDTENDRGIPVDIQVIKNKINESKALIISVNEHNGTVSAFFKNILDWLSRADRNFLADKKILLLSTSPGARGASSALTYIKEVLPRFGGNVVESFSFPSFQENFDVGQNNIKDSLLEMGVQEVVASFLQQLEV